MSRSVQRSMFLCLVVLVTACSSPTAPRQDRNPAAIPDTYIVTFAAGTLRPASPGDLVALATSVAADTGADDVTPLSIIDAVLLRGIDASAAATLARDPRVLSVEQDALVATAAIPWGLDRVDQRPLPLDGAFDPAGSGAGVSIAVVDTGIRASHPEFGGRVAAGMSTIDDGIGSDDCEGHGTHVAGIAAGAVSGVARGANLVPIRVLDCDGTGSISDVILGLEWLIAHRSGPTVVNMSLTGGPSSALDLAVRRVHEAGMPVVVAAGNDPAGRGGDACRLSPARADQAITVAASTRGDHRAPFSFAGPCVDLFAPGEAIPSANARGGSIGLSGTSMAAPHVAGAAALVLQMRPQASPRAVADALMAAATRDVIHEVGIGSPNRLLHVGIGLLPGQPDPEPTPGPAPDPNPDPDPAPDPDPDPYRCDDCRAAEGELEAGAHLTFGAAAFPAGRHVAVLMVPAGADFDLHLERLNGTRWVPVERSATNRRTETVGYDAPAGTYRWRVHAYAGRGDVDLRFGFRDGASDGSDDCAACVIVQGALLSGRAWLGEPFQGAAGLHEAWLTGPDGADFDLYLETQTLDGWVSVARAAGAYAAEHVRHAASDGTYRWRVAAYRGQGDFTLLIRQP